jgi:poly(3-hydroxybutyrate) depolymerase
MTPGCDVEVPPEDGEHTFTLADIERRYVLRLPENYTNEQAWPLIFALHGNGGNPGYWDAVGGDRDIRTAFAQEAIIIIPEAINNAWRDYDADPSTWPAGIELELDFFDTVYETAKNELCLDTENVFSMGFSGGGSFSGVLGCRRDYIRAIAVGGSVIYFEIEDCTETPAAWITIGEMEYTAGREEYLFFFRDHAGCEETSMPGDPKGCVDYDGCGAATPVTYCSHPAGHVWPAIGTDATKAFFQGFYLP